MCGNPGLTQGVSETGDGGKKEMIQYIKERIRGRYEERGYTMPYYQETKKPAKPLLMKNLSMGIAGLFASKTSDAEARKWKDIREGLKLKSILNSKRIMEVG